MTESSSSDGVELMNAELNDLVEGAEIWVRGKKATCTKVDYPHIYWRWFGDDAEKHRSYLCSPHIFKIDRNAKNKKSGGGNNPPDTPTSDSGNSNDNNNNNNNNTDNNNNNSSSSTDSQQQDNNDKKDESSSPSTTTTPTTDSSSSSPAANILKAFASRSATYSLTNIHGTDSDRLSAGVSAELRSIDIMMPQGITIENCSGINVLLNKKIAALTLINVSDSCISLKSVVSKIEIIRCKNLSLTINNPINADNTNDYSIEDKYELISSGGSRLYSIDNSESITISFLSPLGPFIDTEKIQFISCESNDIRLNARLFNQSSFQEIENEIKYTIPSAASLAESSSPSTTINASTQVRTVYSNGSYQAKLFERDGETGFFDNK